MSMIGRMCGENLRFHNDSGLKQRAQPVLRLPLLLWLRQISLNGGLCILFNLLRITRMLRSRLIRTVRTVLLSLIQAKSPEALSWKQVKESKCFHLQLPSRVEMVYSPCFRTTNLQISIPTQFSADHVVCWLLRIYIWLSLAEKISATLKEGQSSLLFHLTW